MKIIAFIITLVSCCLMFFVKRETKAALLLMGAMTLTVVNIPGIPLHWANFLLQAAFLLSEWRAMPRHFIRLQGMPFLWIPLLIVTASALLASLTSRYEGLKDTIQSELLFKYFALAYAFWAVKDEKSLKPILQISLYCLIVLTFFGVLNYIDKSAMFVNALSEGTTSKIQKNTALGDIYTESIRFRVQSLFIYAFDYGYICVAIVIFHIHGWYRRLESKTAFITALACSSFGILMCGCRIVWVSAVLSIVCYYMWSFRLSRNVIYGMIALILMIISYHTIPAVEERVNKVTDVFVENSETKGSSIQLRMSQYMYVRIYTEGNELLGLGKGYWNYNFSKNPDVVSGLQGVESVIFQYMLERGIIGLILWVAFYTVIFIYLWVNRKRRRPLTGLGVSILILYLIFSIGTGELGSVYPTMLLLGFVIKTIDNHKSVKLYIWLAILIIKRRGLPLSFPLIRRLTYRLRSIR